MKAHVARLCSCGTPLEKHQRKCLPCHRLVDPQYGVPYWQRKKTFHKVVACKSCGGDVVRTKPSQNFTLCPTCRVQSKRRHRTQASITLIVSMAVRLGVLRRLDGTVPCVDCGKPATDYDHRDYNKPLDVEPTCHSCNMRRGPAIPLWNLNHPAPTEAAA